MRLHTLIAIAVTMCALPAVAGELPTAPAPRAVPAHVTKVYEVSDIVVPGDGVMPHKGEQLAKLVRSIARPYSWQDNGGRGSAEYFDIGCALVVTNTPDVLREVGDLLEALKRLQAAAPVARAPGELLLALGRPQIGVPVAPAPREAKQSAVIKLRNAAAADAAHAVGAFIKARKLDAVVVAEPVSNSVLLSAEPAIQQQLLAILTALDKQPAQVILQVLVMKVSKDFVEQSGLNVGSAPGSTSWVLSERERHMFNAIIRDAKAHNRCEVLSRPQLQVTDNQIGFVQVGLELPVVAAGGAKTAIAPTGFTYRATPRVMPDGRLLLRAEAQITEKGHTGVLTTAPGSSISAAKFVPCFNTQSVQTTTELKPGETVVIQVGETLVIVTPTVVK